MKKEKYTIACIGVCIGLRDSHSFFLLFILMMQERFASDNGRNVRQLKQTEGLPLSCTSAVDVPLALGLAYCIVAYLRNLPRQSPFVSPEHHHQYQFHL